MELVLDEPIQAELIHLQCVEVDESSKDRNSEEFDVGLDMGWIGVIEDEMFETYDEYLAAHVEQVLFGVGSDPFLGWFLLEWFNGLVKLV